MFLIGEYCERLKAALFSEFGTELVYMGLQGSYLRGEATEESDIDVVVILERLGVGELRRYRRVIEAVGDAHRACGFICSRAEMANWNALEACQMLHSTKDLYGVLAELLPRFTEADERYYIKLSLNNLYHALCHTYIHGTRERLLAHLPAYFKAAYFILQNTHYLESGEFILQKAVLRNQLSGGDRAVMDVLLSSRASFTEADFELLLSWCKETMAKG